jgi:hypothetical protein
VVADREHLWWLLAEAAQLEHMIMCQYLYAEFSLKNGSGDGLTEGQAEAAGGWRKTRHGIAVEEMLHLAGDWRTAHYGRFLTMWQDYQHLRQHDPSSEPARPVLRGHTRQPFGIATPQPVITGPVALQVAERPTRHPPRQGRRVCRQGPLSCAGSVAAGGLRLRQPRLPVAATALSVPRSAGHAWAAGR